MIIKYLLYCIQVHHDRITFSLHEPTRGQTFKSALKRESVIEEETKAVSSPPERPHVAHHSKRPRGDDEQPLSARPKKSHSRTRAKAVEGKGVLKERNDSGYARRLVKNKIKVREDVSEDMSE